MQLNDIEGCGLVVARDHQIEQDGVGRAMKVAAGLHDVDDVGDDSRIKNHRPQQRDLGFHRMRGNRFGETGQFISAKRRSFFTLTFAGFSLRLVHGQDCPRDSRSSPGRSVPRRTIHKRLWMNQARKPSGREGRIDLFMVGAVEF